MKTILLFIAVFACFKVEGQIHTYKYIIGIEAGAAQSIPKSGPKDLAKQSGVKFLKPSSSSINSYFDIRYDKQLLIGFEIAIDEYNYGYLGTHITPINGISSGDLLANDYIYLYKVGVRINYERNVFKRLKVIGSIVPSIGYYPYNNSFDDTAEINHYFHEIRPPGSNKIQYIHYPAIQNQGFHFVLKANALFSYALGNKQKFALTADISYQQGFSSFHTDIVNIRQYDPVTLQPTQNDIYYTKLNGTNLQFHLGIRYMFGKK